MFDFHPCCGVSIRLTAVTAHHKPPCRNSYKIHLYARCYFHFLTSLTFFCQQVTRGCCIKRPIFYRYVLWLRFRSFLGHHWGNRSFTFQISSIIGYFFLPIHTCPVSILVCQFLTAFDLVKSLIRKYILAHDIGIEVTLVRGVIINPVIQLLPFFVCQFHIIMTLFQQTD